jgi:Peptidase A4 family
VNKFYRFTGTAVAGVTLAAAAAAFSAPYAAAQPTTRQAAAAPAIAPPAPHPMIPAAPPPGAAGTSAIGNITTRFSTNWAGYAVTGPKFRRISATFFVPFLNCSVSPGGTDGTFSSHWVGLDGYSSNTVEQDGIEADCDGSTAQYFAWREVYPRDEQPFTMKIKAGDSVTASVRYSRSSGKYRMEVFDNTNGHHRTVHQKCDGSCKRSSAEVISEAPTVNGSQSSLADYGAVSFSGISITDGSGRIGGIKSSHWHRVKIEQVGFSSKNVIARPTVLNGRSFANYWLGEN